MNWNCEEYIWLVSSFGISDLSGSNLIMDCYCAGASVEPHKQRMFHSSAVVPLW